MYKITLISLMISFTLWVGCANLSNSGDGVDLSRILGLTLTNSENSVELQWESITNAQGYEIFWDTLPTVSENAHRIEVDTVGYRHTGLKNQRTYWYVIRAVNGTSKGELSAPKSIIVQGKNLSGISGITVEQISNTISVNWNKNQSTSFQLQWDTKILTETEEHNLVDNITDTKYALNFLKYDSTYYIRLRAIDGNQNVSPWSTVEKIKVISKEQLYVFETDFTTGKAVRYNTSGVGGTPTDVSSDAVIKVADNRLFVLERFGADNILQLNKNNGDVIYQEHIKDGWNPHDIVVVSENKGYVTSNNTSELAIVNPKTGKVTSNIDLSPYTFKPDSNTSPNPSPIVHVGSKIYVGLQRRHGWNPGGETYVLGIDTASNMVVDTFKCKFKNVHQIIHENNMLYVVNPGSMFDSTDGAIESINLSTKEVKTVITEEAVKGSVTDITAKGNGIFYATKYIKWGVANVIEIDTNKGTTEIITEELETVVQAYRIYYSKRDERLYVCDMSKDSFGVKIFDNDNKLYKTIKTSLPPSSLAFVD